FGPKSCLSVANRCGGSQAVTVEIKSMILTGPTWETTAPPMCSSTSVGKYQDGIPGPVAMACPTSSGVPGTSTSTWTDRRPDASFFTLMITPFIISTKTAADNRC